MAIDLGPKTLPVQPRERRSAAYGSLWKTNILGNETIMVFGEEECRKLLREEGRLVEVIWPEVTTELVRVPAVAVHAFEHCTLLLTAALLACRWGPCP
jgi:hypothetical protein